MVRVLLAHQNEGLTEAVWIGRLLKDCYVGYGGVRSVGGDCPWDKLMAQKIAMVIQL